MLYREKFIESSYEYWDQTRLFIDLNRICLCILNDNSCWLSIFRTDRRIWSDNNSSADYTSRDNK